MAEKTQREYFYRGAQWAFGQAESFVRDGGDDPDYVLAAIQIAMDVVIERLKKYELEEW